MASLCFLILALLAPAALASPLFQQLQQSQFTGFVRLLEHADVIPEIESALRSGKSLTIFAPTDDALVYHTSPTLLAFLKLEENKATLRKVLLSHLVTERLSPFQWEGAHDTLAGTPLKLTMDASAFYAHDVAVKQYNALVLDEASVHALPTLIMPSDVAVSTKTFVEEATEVRRVLVSAAAAPNGGVPNQPMTTTDRTPAITTGPKTDAAPSSASGTKAAGSAVILAVAFVAAMM